jgi:hypothetical protein
MTECQNCNLPCNLSVECKRCPNIGCDKCMPNCLECSGAFCDTCEAKHKLLHAGMFDYIECSICDQPLGFEYKLLKCKFHSKLNNTCTEYGCANCMTYCSTCESNLCTGCPKEYATRCSKCQYMTCCFKLNEYNEPICDECSSQYKKNTASNI